MDAQVLLMNRWDNILHHLVGITAAMEVWPVQTPGSSSSSTTEEDSPLEEEPITGFCPDEGNHTQAELDTTRKQHWRSGKTLGPNGATWKTKSAAT